MMNVGELIERLRTLSQDAPVLTCANNHRTRSDDPLRVVLVDENLRSGSERCVMVGNCDAHYFRTARPNLTVFNAG